MKVKAKKDLFMDGSKTPSFTKGNVYESTNNYPTHLSDNIFLIDDQGDAHRLGSWFTNFKIVK